MYDENSDFISVGMAENVVESVVRKLLGIAVPSGMESEALHWWMLNFGDHRKKLHISVEIFVNWLANNIPPWYAYYAFMSGRLIALDKLLGIHLVGVRENWRQLFDKCVMKITGNEDTHTFKDDQLCAGLKS